MFFLDLDLIGLTVLFVVLCIICQIMHKKDKKEHRIWRYILCAYIVVLIKITMFPICIGRYERNWEGYNVIQLVPFNTIKQVAKYGNWIQIVGNICLLIPVAIIIYRIYDINNKWKLLSIVAIVSLGIEFVQYIIFVLTNYPSRIVDVDDVILNIIGGVICVWMIIPIFDKLIRIRQ